MRHKIYCNNLVPQTEIAHVFVEERKAESSEPVLEGHHDHVPRGGHHGGVRVLQRAEVESSRVNPDHYRQESLRDSRSVNIEIETVLVC